MRALSPSQRVAAAELYIVHRVSANDIGSRMGARGDTVRSALREIGVPLDGERRDFVIAGGGELGRVRRARPAS